MHKREVLTPYKIVLPSEVAILDASLIRTSRNICGLRIHSTERPNEYGVDFNILEPRDGAAIQIIYSGNRFADIRVDGLVEGQADTHRIDIFGVPRDEAATLHAALFRDWHFVLGAIFYFSSMPLLLVSMRRLRRAKLNRRDELKRAKPGVLIIIREFLTILSPAFLALLLVLAGMYLAFGTMWGRFSAVPSSILGSR